MSAGQGLPHMSVLHRDEKELSIAEAMFEARASGKGCQKGAIFFTIGKARNGRQQEIRSASDGTSGLWPEERAVLAQPTAGPGGIADDGRDESPEARAMVPLLEMG